MIAVLLHALSYCIIIYCVIFLGPKISGLVRLLEITFFLLPAFSANFISFYYVKNVRNKFLFYLFSHSAFVIVSSVLGLILTTRFYSSVPVIFVCWPFFFVNVMAYLLFILVKRGKEIAAAGVFIVSILMMWATITPYMITMEKLDDLVEHGIEQRIYRYRENYYFVGNKKPGVFKLTPDGSVSRIIDSDTRIADHNAQIQTMDHEDRFCVKENILYFKAGKEWEKYNLDNNEILAVENGEKEAKCGFMNAPDLTQILGVKPFIEYSQISDDGYIFYSNDEGLFKTRPVGGQPQILVSGPVTVFSVEEGMVTYYHVNRQRIEKQTIPVIPPKPSSTDKKTVALQPTSTEKKTVAPPANNNDRVRAAQFHAEGLNYFGQSQFVEAIQVWSQEFALDRTNANTANNIAIAYNKLGEYDKAIEYTKVSLGLSSEFGHAYYTMGTAYEDMKDFEQAKRCFQKSVEKRWDLQGSYYHLGYAYQKLNDHENAIMAYKKSLEFNPSDPGVHLLIGKSCAAIGKYWSARKEFHKEIDMHSYHELYAQKELQKLRKRVWYLQIIDHGPPFLLSVLIWLVPIISLFCFVYFMKRAGEFFRPDKTKIIALTLFVFLFPFPMFIVLGAGILPPFLWYLIMEGLGTAMIGGYSFLGYFFALIIYLVMLFVCYLIVCGLYTIMKPKSLLWGVTAVLLVASFLNIYIFASPTGQRWTRATSIYKGFFNGIVKPQKADEINLNIDEE
jgi:Flp pilus assembly protein TadD